MGRFPNGDRPSRKRLAAPDRLVGSGHPLSVSRDRIRYAPGTVTALTRSADAAGVLVVGGLLTLLTWVVTPIWVGGALLFPRSSCSRRWRSPAFVARGYFVRVLTAGIATGNADGAPPFVAWNELYRNGLKSALLSAVLLAPLVLGAALAAALAIGALGNGLVDLASVAEPVRAALGGGGRGGRRRGRGRARRDGRRGVSPRVRVRQAGGARGVRRVRTPPRRPSPAPRRPCRWLRHVRHRVAGGGRNAGRWLHAGWPVRPARSRRRARLRRPRRRARSVRAGCGDGAGSGRCGRRRRSDRSDRGGSGPRRSIGRPRTPPTPEVPPMVQTGRSVPLGRTGVRETGAGGTRAGRARVDDSVPDGPGGAVGADGGFDWNAPDGKSVDRDGVSPDDTASGEFEWDVDVDDREDKN